MRPLLPVLTLSAMLVAAPPGSAQTLSSRPAVFADPSLDTDSRYGELVLGRTTLASALRIFAMELEDSVRVPLRHPSNPDTLWTSTELPGDAPSTTHYRLDIGAGRYTLYFDKRERLVAAITPRSRLPRPIRRDELVARYPTLKVQRVARTAEGAWVKDDLMAPLAPCISLVADVWRRDKGMVGSFGYIYTCTTTAAPQKAVLDREP
jgi:hypothetical protein